MKIAPRTATLSPLFSTRARARVIVPLALAVASALTACGGKGQAAPPATAPPSDRAETSARAAAYCDGYRGCAEERARIEDFEGKGDDELSPDERTQLADAVAGRQTACRETYEGLTPSQQDWLESCTGCGGSCDVYDCLDQAGAIAEGVAFECDFGDQELGDEGSGE